MTKNRARKQAARDRAALTGERYVVAQRALAEEPDAAPAPQASGPLHAFAHRVPGMPEHVDGGLQARAPHRRQAVRHHGNRQHTQRRHGEPRVLVAWQNWIAGHVGARS